MPIAADGPWSLWICLSFDTRGPQQNLGTAHADDQAPEVAQQQRVPADEGKVLPQVGSSPKPALDLTHPNHNRD